MPLLVDQELGEVPLDAVSQKATLAGFQILVDGRSIVTIHINLKSNKSLSLEVLHNNQAYLGRIHLKQYSRVIKSILNHKIMCASNKASRTTDSFHIETNTVLCIFLDTEKKGMLPCQRWGTQP
jgi:hypothetical protein